MTNNKEFIEKLNIEYQKELREQTHVVIVLDDDPTGVQTVHGVPVYTKIDVKSIDDGFGNENMFFILTNSRGLTAEQSEKMHTEIATLIARSAKKHNRKFILISRGDSTLRGHYPLETDTLRTVLEKKSVIKYSGEIISPVFFEGNRITVNDIHYLLTDNKMLPVGETEFSKDKTFGYRSSNLKDWIEEKTNRGYLRDDVLAINLNDYMSLGSIDRLTDLLTSIRSFTKIILNASNYNHLKIFTIALFRAQNSGINFIFRTAASLPKTIGGISDKPLLTKKDIVKETNSNGGLIVVGSHVDKTTKQLEALKTLTNLVFIEFNQHLVLDDQKIEIEVQRVKSLIFNTLSSGKDAVVFTKRTRIDFGGANKEEELKLARRISDTITDFVSTLEIEPKYIIAKGGITSSEIGTIGLNVTKAIVQGQIIPGVPVWLTDNRSRFPLMSYIIFPGNVGEDNSLNDVLQTLK